MELEPKIGWDDITKPSTVSEDFSPYDTAVGEVLGSMCLPSFKGSCSGYSWFISHKAGPNQRPAWAG